MENIEEFCSAKFQRVTVSYDTVSRSRRHLNFRGDAMETKVGSTNMKLYPLRKETLQQQNAAVSR